MNVHSDVLAKPEPCELIMDAALELFAERGYHGTAVPQIARRAQVGTGTIYRYFDSKERLVNVLYRREKQALMSRLRAALHGADGARAQVRQLWFGLAEYARARPLSFAFLELHHHGEYLDRDSRELEMKSLFAIAELLERARGAGLTKTVSTPVLMSLAWGAMVGLVKAHELGYLQLDDDLIAETEQAWWVASRR